MTQSARLVVSRKVLQAHAEITYATTSARFQWIVRETRRLFCDVVKNILCSVVDSSSEIVMSVSVTMHSFPSYLTIFVKVFSEYVIDHFYCTIPGVKTDT